MDLIAEVWLIAESLRGLNRGTPSNADEFGMMKLVMRTSFLVGADIANGENTIAVRGLFDVERRGDVAGNQIINRRIE